MKPLLWLKLLFLLCLALPGSAELQAAEPVVRFGVLMHNSSDDAVSTYQPLQQFLSEQLQPMRVELVFIEPDMLELPGLQATTDFLLTDPYHYILLKNQGYTLPPLLSQVTLTESGLFELAGGVMFCLVSNPLCDLNSMPQASIAAAGPHSLLGYVAQLRELQHLGVRLSANLVQHNVSDADTVAAVLNQRADIGFIRSGAVEQLFASAVVTEQMVRILNTQQLIELPVYSSTRLYPDWPVLVMPAVSSGTISRVMAALLNWEAQARTLGMNYAFGAPADYLSVEHSLKALAFPPYQLAPAESFMHSWSDHKEAVLLISAQGAFLLLLLLVFIYRSRADQKTCASLRQSNELLALQKLRTDKVINNTAHLLLLGLDSGGTVLHFNDNALKLLNSSEAELQGKVFLDWLPDEKQHSVVLAALNPKAHSSTQATVVNLQVHLPNGKELFLDVDLFCLPGESASQVRFVLLGIDVSRRYTTEKRLQKSFKRLDVLIERSPAVICAFDPFSMRLNYISPNCFNIYLKSSMEIMRMQDWWNLSVHPDSQEQITKKLMDWRDAGHQGVLNYSCILVRNPLQTGLLVEDPELHQQQICIESQFCALRDEHGLVTEVIGSQVDISERYYAQMKQELAASVFVQAREGIFITDASGTILDLNHSFCRITGYSEQEALGCHLALLGASDSDKLYFEALWDKLSKAGFWEGEINGQRKNGEAIVLALTISVVRNMQHQAIHYVALFSDITLQKAQEDKLRFIAHFDALTGLPNRLLLKDRIEQNMALTKRSKQLMAVIFIDIDGFKAVNDSLGHAAGDDLLVELANRMRAVMRENDTLARLGGDEFIALLTNLVSEEDCFPLIKRLLLAASTPFELRQQQAKVSASIGITFYPQQDAVDDAALIRQADLAMYEAKNSGKNRYAVYHQHDKELIELDATEG
ncbi:diguanylate cyclase [Rheinheimera sediminis]|uniref:diguanylate cyclase domain-containing protein n=1 Tax=Rheinheimera sp. YQF-1 TaxID=2499626 RepID=UPI000FD7D741|nr:diguanylate cyclase [Rheinheimera sp. YQF-1]RVT46868.1 diguanylate cyclase [Rheinheimera sp. YQF-1]